MYSLKDNTKQQQSGHTADEVHGPAAGLALSWERGRARLTPWAYQHMRALGLTRLAAGIFLVGLGALLIADGNWRWAAIPLIGAALNLSIGYLDTAGARFAAPRT